MSKNVPKTNAISERDMAILDNLFIIKGQACSQILHSRNCAYVDKKWLCNLPVSERHATLESAQKLAPQYIEIIQNRQKDVETQIANKLAEKKAKQEKSEQTKMTNKLSISREIVKFGGVWDKSQTTNQYIRSKTIERGTIGTNKISQSGFTFKRFKRALSGNI
ncbi:unnamed protein product [Mytilus coruscus]|uniref:Uncharacterized protein n=1 Tax=Mytilus coruscus TaxID=42192 RepID=A0A6J8E969_MYTCO|nr:unnamed protein product [Mytilus coruscus]